MPWEWEVTGDNSLGIDDKSLSNEVYRTLRDAAEEFPRERELTLRYVEVGLLLRVSREGRVTAEQDVREHAHRPHVRCQSQRLIREDLWGCQIIIANIF